MTTSLFSLTGNHWLIREIIPFYGRTIQVSEIDDCNWPRKDRSFWGPWIQAPGSQASHFSSEAPLPRSWSCWPLGFSAHSSHPSAAGRRNGPVGGPGSVCFGQGFGRCRFFLGERCFLVLWCFGVTISRASFFGERCLGGSRRTGNAGRVGSRRSKMFGSVHFRRGEWWLTSPDGAKNGSRPLVKRRWQVLPLAAVFFEQCWACISRIYNWMVVWNIFIFPYIENNHPNWLMFFKGVAQPPASWMGCEATTWTLQVVPSTRCECRASRTPSTVTEKRVMVDQLSIYHDGASPEFTALQQGKWLEMMVFNGFHKEIIPFHGRTIQVSDVFWFTQMINDSIFIE